MQSAIFGVPSSARERLVLKLCYSSHRRKDGNRIFLNIALRQDLERKDNAVPC